eukprot:TRINITY_DN106709_c0_g1_i1.p1 TRINITY_DN106709_c0_g1~~TRINITY_DN106709_c0_g1_i1.p1  ORF type:complete len:123 (+),score=16.47 TRINITY_DN106709_c0_g1_i1:195-563(+)
MAVVGYSTLSGWPYVLRAVDDPHVAAIALELGRTPAQILLRHSVQHGLAVIPSSAGKERLRQNMQIFDFEIAPRHMMMLDSLVHLVSPAQDGSPSWIPDRFGARLVLQKPFSRPAGHETMEL